MIAFLKSLFQEKQNEIVPLIERGALIIDVRSSAEFNSGHATGAINIPLGNLSNHLKEIQQQEKPVITCCRSGARSGIAATNLKAIGIEAYNAGRWTKVQKAMEHIKN